MKGVFLVLLMIGLLIVSLMVVKNISNHQTLEGDVSQIKAMDKAKEAADLMNQHSDMMQKRLQHATQD